MSLSFGLVQNQFYLNKMSLPSRYYYFNGNNQLTTSEPYLKLLNIGEGIFPKDRINTCLKLEGSELVMTTESATKVYADEGSAFGLNRINIDLDGSSNLEFINDELILYKNARFTQIFRLSFANNTTFFYSDILSRGRSYEHFDFSRLKVKNTFFSEGVEYLEKFDLSGIDLKNYLIRRKSRAKVFVKVYLKTRDNVAFLKILFKHHFSSFVKSQSNKMLIGVLSDDNMGKVKDLVNRVWRLYREQLGKASFALGKQ